MYGRKVKLTGKKKPKAPNPNGSSWGPRIALYERQKALQGTTTPSLVGLPGHTTNQNSYAVSGEILYKSGSGGGSSVGSAQPRATRPFKKVSTSSSSQDGSNNYIYNSNYPRIGNNNRKVSNSSGGTVIASSSCGSSGYSHSRSHPGGRSSYILGSNTGSQMTLAGSSVGAEPLTQPLSLIIPNQGKVAGFDSDFDDEQYNVLDRSQDSFPSTNTYRSSSSSSEEDDHHAVHELVNKCQSSRGREGLELDKAVRKVSEPPTSKCEISFSNPGITLGILQMSTTQPQIHQTSSIPVDTPDSEKHSLLPGGSETNNSSNSFSSLEPETMRCMEGPYIMSSSTVALAPTKPNNLNKETPSRILKSFKSEEMSDLKYLSSFIDSTPKSKTGSTISSLAHGITMVYVPMESLPRSKSAAVLNASIEYDPELEDLVVQEKGKDNEIEIIPTEAKDPDNDSLLESFDSIMFKPKQQVEPHLHQHHPLPCSGNNILKLPSSDISSPLKTLLPSSRMLVPPPPPPPITQTPTQKSDNQQEPRQQDIPPPLPPKNPVQFPIERLQNDKKQFGGNPFEQKQLCQAIRSKSIQAAVQNLENIINPPTKNQPLIKHEGPKKSHDVSKKVLKRVTLSLPGEIPPRQHELMLNLRNNESEAEIDAYSSTFLTCGHVLKDDTYSTLSSTHSAMVGILSDNGEDDTLSIPPSPGQSPNNENTDQNRSVLQQLRELSILIGGGNREENNDAIFNDLRNGKDNANQGTTESFRLHVEAEPKRKTSDATDNSADSGKGSGSGSSPKSLQSSPDSEIEKGKQSKKASGCSVSSKRCVFRSDCNECLMFNKPPEGFQKPEGSEELCSHTENNTMRKSTINSIKRPSTSAKLVRRKSSKGSKLLGTNKYTKYKKKKPLILDFCDCNCCESVSNLIPESQFLTNHNHDINESNSSSSSIRKISTTSSSSGASSGKLARSVAFRNSIRSSKPKTSVVSQCCSSNGNSPSSCCNGLFTIEETEESPSLDSRCKKKGLNLHQKSNYHQVKPQFKTDGNLHQEGDISVTNGVPHWHPNCWLANDTMLGWSDLESLYSLNLKNDKPLSINGECWTCWQEISEIKRNSENPNGTVDRTKRMFIWLNKRPKEFQAPWWEAKKQASIRWVMTKALVHVPKEYLIDPFKESKKAKSTKYRLRDEVVRGLVSGKLYSLSIENLYKETLPGNGNNNTGYPKNGLNHWEIIKILSRRGVYVAQPSDMKLTEGTLRQKPIRIAAHIALIEAIMGLYSKEILGRERIISTLLRFGCTVKPETTSPERLVIAWINAAVLTLKTYILSTRSHQLPQERQTRWIKLPPVGEIRDLCDGIGICSLFAIYCSNDLSINEISVPEPGETLTIYDSISNHSAIQKLCEELFPETIYHLCVTDFLYIHGYMKQNILCFLVDLFIHLEVNPITRVNRLTHVPIRVEL